MSSFNQQYLAILEVAADWHELILQYCSNCVASVVSANGQLDHGLSVQLAGLPSIQLSALRFHLTHSQH